MPIIHKVEQGSQEWFMLRMGRPTASEFHRIVTPGGKLSSQCDAYAHRLIAERILNKPIISEIETQWMLRGRDLEEEAARAYEFQTEQKTEPVGFITNDERTYGASLDRLVGDDGAVEIKVPSPQIHISYMVSFKEFAKDKRPQVQGELLCSDRRWIDLMSYHPELPRVIHRVERDEAYITLLKESLEMFCNRLDRIYADAVRMYGPFTRATQQDPAFITDDDVNAILARHGFERRV